MDSIEYGGVRIALRIGNDGIGAARFNGLLLPGNVLTVSAITLGLGSSCGAKGLLYRNDRAAVCCDPQSMAASYATYTPRQRVLPVAFVVNAAQVALYERVVQRATAAGMLRRMFYCEHEAHDWLRHTVRLLDENAAWWATRG